GRGVGGSGGRASGAIAGAGPASVGTDALLAVRQLRTRRPGADHADGGIAQGGGDRGSLDGGGDRQRVEGRNLARGPMEQLQRRPARPLYRIRGQGDLRTLTYANQP